mmetsp:Transcript_23195/g.68144  ORF Transcript_23195/g.68144 Transcript_23195/m.68144 type:complete len:342 (-) Transcript_23195:201-1226(-)
MPPLRLARICRLPYSDTPVSDAEHLARPPAALAKVDGADRCVSCVCGTRDCAARAATRAACRHAPPCGSWTQATARTKAAAGMPAGPARYRRRGSSARVAVADRWCCSIGGNGTDRMGAMSVPTPRTASKAALRTQSAPTPSSPVRSGPPRPCGSRAATCRAGGRPSAASRHCREMGPPRCRASSRRADAVGDARPPSSPSRPGPPQHSRPWRGDVWDAVAWSGAPLPRRRPRRPARRAACVPRPSSWTAGAPPTSQRRAASRPPSSHARPARPRRVRPPPACGGVCARPGAAFVATCCSTRSGPLTTTAAAAVRMAVRPPPPLSNAAAAAAAALAEALVA